MDNEREPDFVRAFVQGADGTLEEYEDPHNHGIMVLKAGDVIERCRPFGRPQWMLVELSDVPWNHFGVNMFLVPEPPRGMVRACS